MKYIPIILISLLTACGGSSGQTPTPQPPHTPAPVEEVHLSPKEIGVIVTNTAGDISIMEEVAATGTGLVRLSHYMLSPGFEHRMREDVDAAHSAGLEVYMDLQWWPLRGDFDLFEWTMLVGKAMDAFPDVKYFSVHNEANEEDFWPYSREEYILAFNVTQEAAHQRDRLIVGPDITTTGDWRNWLALFLQQATPDILSIHPIGTPEEIANMIQSLPGTQPVWVTEVTHLTFEGRVEKMRGVSLAQSRQSRWERTYWYHWYAEPFYPASIIRGTELERTMREIIR